MKSRVYAALIDGFLFVLLFFMSEVYLDNFKNANFLWHVYCIFISIFVYYFLIEFIFYTSPGKWLYNLKIRTVTYQKPPRHLILLRSAMKVFLLFSVVGTVFVCIALLSNHELFYDTSLDLTICQSNN